VDGLKNDWVPVEAGRRADLASGAGRESRLRDRPYFSNVSPLTPHQRGLAHSVVPIRESGDGDMSLTPVAKRHYFSLTRTCPHARHRVHAPANARRFKIRWTPGIMCESRPASCGEKIVDRAFWRGSVPPPPPRRYRLLASGQTLPLTRIEFDALLTVKPILPAFVNQTSLTGAG